MKLKPVLRTPTGKSPPGADLEELLSLTASVPYDDQENIHAKLSDLSRDLIVEYLTDVQSDLAKKAKKLPIDELGRQMGIVTGIEEMQFPINVGLLFFNPEPWRFFKYTQIDVVWFPEGRGGDRFTEKEFKGPLHKMVREALAYINATYLSTTVVKHNDRAEADRVSNFPYEAIEEALVNAVYHRDYKIREPVEVTITKDELMVMSYPGPDRSVKTSDLVKGHVTTRRYRNRRIGEFLKELDLTEGRGTGIPKIFRAMKNNGSPRPKFKTDDEHTFFATILPIHRDAKAAAPNLRGDLHGDLHGDLRGDLRGNLRGDLRGDLDGREGQVPETILRVVEMLDGEVTRQQLSGHRGHHSALGHREHFRKEYLQPALEAEGFVEMTEPDKPNSRSPVAKALPPYELRVEGASAAAAFFCGPT